MARRHATISIVGLFLAACLSLGSHVAFAGGDGTAPEKAVVIQGAHDTEAGIRAEHEWIAAHHPGAEVTGQRLGGFQGRPQDVLTIRMPSGEEQIVYFDISGFFGKGQ